MKPGQILNPQIADAVARLGHTDLVMVTDAGFPIPDSVRRVDLAVEKGLPSVPQVLRMLARHLFVENVAFAPEAATHNPQLYNQLQEIYTGSGATFEGIDHTTLCDDVVQRCKLVIRTGDFDPWANVVLTASTDPFAWFTDEAVAEGLEILPAYVERRERIQRGEVPSLQN